MMKAIASSYQNNQTKKTSGFKSTAPFSCNIGDIQVDYDCKQNLSTKRPTYRLSLQRKQNNGLMHHIWVQSTFSFCDPDAHTGSSHKQLPPLHLHSINPKPDWRRRCEIHNSTGNIDSRISYSYFTPPPPDKKAFLFKSYWFPSE